MTESAKRILEGVQTTLLELSNCPPKVSTFSKLCSSLAEAASTFGSERHTICLIIDQMLDILSERTEYKAVPQFYRFLGQILYSRCFFYPPGRLHNLCDLVAGILEKQLSYLPVAEDLDAFKGQKKVTAVPAFRPGVIGGGEGMTDTTLELTLPEYCDLDILWLLDACHILVATLRQAMILHEGRQHVHISSLVGDLMVSRLFACVNALRQNLGLNEDSSGVGSSAAVARERHSPASLRMSQEILGVTIPTTLLATMTEALAEACAYLALFSPSFANKFTGGPVDTLLQKTDTLPIFSTRLSCFSLFLVCGPQKLESWKSLPPYLLCHALKHLVSSCAASVSHPDIQFAQEGREPGTKRTPMKSSIEECKDAVDTPTGLCWATFLLCSTLEECGFCLFVVDSQHFALLTKLVGNSFARLTAFMGYRSGLSAYGLRAHSYLALLARLIHLRNSPLQSPHETTTFAVCKALLDSGGLRFLRHCMTISDPIVCSLATETLVRFYSFSAGLERPVFHRCAARGGITPASFGQDVWEVMNELRVIERSLGERQPSQGSQTGGNGSGEPPASGSPSEHQSGNATSQQEAEPGGRKVDSESIASGTFLGPAKAGGTEDVPRSPEDDASPPSSFCFLLLHLECLRMKIHLCLCELMYLSFEWTGEASRGSIDGSLQKESSAVLAGHPSPSPQAFPEVFPPEEATNLLSKLARMAFAHLPLCLTLCQEPCLEPAPPRRPGGRSSRSQKRQNNFFPPQVENHRYLQLDEAIVDPNASECGADTSIAEQGYPDAVYGGKEASAKSLQRRYLLVMATSFRFRCLMELCAVVLCTLIQQGKGDVEPKQMKQLCELLAARPSPCIAYAMHSRNMFDRVSAGILLWICHQPWDSPISAPSLRKSMLAAVYIAGGGAFELSNIEGSIAPHYSPAWDQWLCPELHASWAFRLDYISVFHLLGGPGASKGKNWEQVSIMLQNYISRLDVLLDAPAQAKLASEADQLRTEVAEARKLAEALEGERDSLTKDLAACRDDLKRQQGVSDDLRSSMQEAERQSKEAQAQLQSQLQTALQSVEASRQSLRASEEEVAALREDLRSRGEEAEKLHQEVRDLSQQLAAVNGKLSRHIAAISQIRAATLPLEEGN